LFLLSGCCGTVDLAVLIGPINSRANISFSRFSLMSPINYPGELSKPRHRRIDRSRVAFERIARFQRLLAFGLSNRGPFRRFLRLIFRRHGRWRASLRAYLIKGLQYPPLLLFPSSAPSRHPFSASSAIAHFINREWPLVIIRRITISLDGKVPK